MIRSTETGPAGPFQLVENMGSPTYPGGRGVPQVGASDVLRAAEVTLTSEEVGSDQRELAARPPSPPPGLRPSTYSSISPLTPLTDDHTPRAISVAACSAQTLLDGSGSSTTCSNDAMGARREGVNFSGSAPEHHISSLAVKIPAEAPREALPRSSERPGHATLLAAHVEAPGDSYLPGQAKGFKAEGPGQLDPHFLKPAPSPLQL